MKNRFNGQEGARQKRSLSLLVVVQRKVKKNADFTRTILKHAHVFSGNTLIFFRQRT